MVMELVNLLLRGLEAAGRACIALLELTNIRDGIRSFLNDLKRAKRRGDKES
jgi:hypothetical protein